MPNRWFPISYPCPSLCHIYICKSFMVYYWSNDQYFIRCFETSPLVNIVLICREGLIVIPLAFLYSLDLFIWKDLSLTFGENFNSYKTFAHLEKLVVIYLANSTFSWNLSYKLVDYFFCPSSENNLQGIRHKLMVITIFSLKISILNFWSLLDIISVL